jgi:general secretion pathway protein D
MIRLKLSLFISAFSLLVFFTNVQNGNAQIPVQPKTPTGKTDVNGVSPATAREEVLSRALTKALPLFGEFTAYVKRTSLNITLYVSEEDRKNGASPLVVFNRGGVGYKALVDNNGFGTKTEVSSTTGEDIDYRKVNTQIASLCKLLVDEQRFDEASQIIDRFLNEYRKNIKDIENNYKTEFESVKVYIAVSGLKKRTVNFIEDNARQAFAEKKYDKAIILINAAQKINIVAIDQIGKFRAECKTDPLGMKKLKGLMDEGLRKTETLKGFEKDCNTHVASDKFDKETDFSTFDPERPLRQSDIDVLRVQAKVLIDNEEYVRARDALEKVLTRDPYNEKATKLLQVVYDKLYQAGKLRRVNEEREIIAENRWNWNQAVSPTPAIKPAQGAVAVEKSELADKLSEIIMDNADFEEATISSAVSYLMQRSKELDPSPNKKGINIVVNIPKARIENMPTITMSLVGIPIGEVIRYICQASDLKYQVGERAVIISSEITDPMETRFFKVRAAMINNIDPAAITQDANQEFTTGGGTAIDLNTTFDKGKNTATVKAPLSSQLLKDYFSQRGVDFTDPNTAIAYDSRGGKLVVKNTPENLRRLEALLRDLDIETPLILIEAKFIELTQTDTEEMGFEWMLNKTTNGQPNEKWTSWSSGGVIPGVSGANGVPVPASTASSTMMDTFTNDKIINNLQRTNSAGLPVPIPGFGKDKLYLDVIVHAMDQSGKAEILSAPKVIATSGQPALMRMVRQESFPESWNEPVVTVGDNLVQITPAYPELGTGTDLGITLDVTATVSPNNYTISLNLHPQIREMINWQDYPYTIIITNTPAAGASTTQKVNQNLKMPIFSLRDVVTNVKVYDGETLILGGMIRDNIAKSDDRLSGIGDIPLVGRLFRSQNELSVKQNLLIFVTARLVNPDGVPVRMGETRGVPDFRR